MEIKPEFCEMGLEFEPPSQSRHTQHSRRGTHPAAVGTYVAKMLIKNLGEYWTLLTNFTHRFFVLHKVKVMVKGQAYVLKNQILFCSLESIFKITDSWNSGIPSLRNWEEMSAW